nr:hypothetical protein [Tanacetum cinerariifolium]
MTTSVRNNSVLGSFFEKKITGPNFIDWYRQLWIILSAKNKENYLEHPIPAAPVAAPRQQVPSQALAAHAAWNYNMHRMGKTVNELHAMLKIHEQTLPKKDATPALHAISAERVQKNQNKKPHKATKGNQGKGKAKMGYAHVHALSYALKPKNPPPPKKDNPAQDAICHQCGEEGHWRRNCPVYLVELLKKKKLSQGASTSGSRKLKQGALSLYVGDSHRAVVEAIGEYHLCLPSGLVLILHSCHYAPSITRGIISISRLYDDGFINHFDDNILSVFRNKMVCFCAIPKDGIYEINLSSSNTNDTSIKKRIEKLQHDGLLNSTDIKSFEKYVSCMSRKMARKPYSHQVKRAKDLLGLIYANVCGPFRTMSRQGASYFVTFTDDFSRYGYVYLLKHKHEVFKTFKVFQKEVENHLGKTIKSLRSDRRGEYMSQEFFDHLKEHGIIAYLTPPYTPQHNGYSFYYPPENRVFVARNAEFFKNSLITQEASRSLEDLEIIQEEDMHPSINTSLNHEEDDQEINELQSDINPIHKSTWTRRAPDRICLHVDAEEHELRDLGEATNYKAALLDPESDKWLDAMNVEICFAMKNLEEAAYILGIKIYQDRSRRLIGLCQSAYIEKILKRYFMENSKHGTISMQENLKLSKLQDMFLVYGGDTKREFRVSCYTDAGYLIDADDLKSQTGYVFILNGDVVDWKSTKQSIFATSSTEAEYLAAYDVSKEAVWIQTFIFGLGIVLTIKEPIKIYCDNTVAIAIAKESVITKCARHYHAKVHYLRQVIEYGDVKIEKVRTYDNLVDPFTKALPYPKHSKLTKNIGITPASSLI